MRRGAGLLITTDIHIMRDAIFASGKSPSLPSPSLPLGQATFVTMSYIRPDGRTDGRADGWMDGQTARVKYHSAPPPRDSFETAALLARSVGRSVTR